LARSRVPILAWRLGPGVAAADAQALIQERAPLAGPDMPILVPLDGSRFAEAALPVAEDLARRFGAYLVLVRAADDESALVATFHGGATPGTEEITAEQEARAYLQRAQAAVERQRLGVVVIAQVGSPARVIDRAWRENNAGLIVMASHGKTGMATRFLGSVAARTIEDVHAPVLVVRPEVKGG
jgi:nucleotide-binding universal stress UspA family protein